jgi:hypothetical protein
MALIAPDVLSLPQACNSCCRCVKDLVKIGVFLAVYYFVMFEVGVIVNHGRACPVFKSTYVPADSCTHDVPRCDGNEACNSNQPDWGGHFYEVTKVEWVNINLSDGLLTFMWRHLVYFVRVHVETFKELLPGGDVLHPIKLL